MVEKEILYIWLSKVNGIGPVLATNLLEYFGNIDRVFKSKKEELLEVDGIGEKLANVIIKDRNLYHSRKVYEKCKKLKIEVITKESDNYPEQLKCNIKAPIVLYLRGRLKSFESSVSIVGSRRCTSYGKDITVEITEKLSNSNITIISGMAKGIDSYAHTVSLNNGNFDSLEKIIEDAWNWHSKNPNGFNKL
ncbi:MAG: DNA-processing protein DprA [Peptostreptococcaceae bacterium]